MVRFPLCRAVFQCAGKTTRQAFTVTAAAARDKIVPRPDADRMTYVRDSLPRRQKTACPTCRMCRLGQAENFGWRHVGVAIRYCWGESYPFPRWPAGGSPSCLPNIYTERYWSLLVSWEPDRGPPRR